MSNQFPKLKRGSKPGRIISEDAQFFIAEQVTDLYIDEVIHRCNNYERLKDMLDECRLQLEYLNEKFKPTGTTAVVLARTESLLAELNKQPA